LIRIAITAEAFTAIAGTLPLGSNMVEPQPTVDGGRFIWLERFALSKLDSLRRPGEDSSEIIIRLAQIEASKPGRKRGSRSSG
jgi:hypothetical protein